MNIAVPVNLLNSQSGSGHKTHLNNRNNELLNQETYKQKAMAANFTDKYIIETQRLLYIVRL